nr:SGNH/GDSL hydrolase family protein [Nocardioides luti]
MGDSLTQADTGRFDARPGPASWVAYAVSGRSPWSYVADVAVGGQTLVQMAERFEQDVLARDPEGVVIMGGTNDVLQGLPVEPSVASLVTMVGLARDAGAQVWVIGPPAIDAAYAKPVTPMVEAQRRAAEQAGATYVDIGPDDRLYGRNGDWLPGLSFDGVHPTPEGARALAGVILDRLAE